MRSSDYYGQDPSVATTNIPSDNDSDRRPSDSSTSSEESAFYNIGMGHAQHEERRYLVYPNNSGPGMGYASSIRVQGFEETDQPSYRRLSVKDLLNPRPSTPQMSLLSVGNTDFSRLVYETQAHLRELHGNLKATEPIQGRDLEGQFGRERERGGVVVKFPSTFPRITQDRLPVMVASEVLPVDPSSVVPSQTGDVHSQSQSPARSSSSPSAMDSSPPSSHVSGSQASGARKTSPGRDDLKSSGSAAGTRRIGEGHRSHVVRGGNLCGIKGNKDNQGDDSSVSSHGQSPRSEVESE